MLRYVPGALGGVCLVTGAALWLGVAAALIVAGVLLLLLDGRVR